MSRIEVKIFAEGAAGQMRERLPEEYQAAACRVLEVTKNNSVGKTGIQFRMPDSTAAPVVYVEPFYEEVRRGRPLGEVLDAIAKSAAEAMEDLDLLGGLDVASYDSVKEHLKVGVINTKANQAMLLGHPHKDVEDLSAICRIEIPQADGGSAAIKVSNQMLEQWGIGKDALFKKALENTREKDPFVLVGMEEIMWEMEGGRTAQGNLLEEGQEPDADGFLYVLTNPERQNGAAAILYPETLKQIGRAFPEGYYLLPSSVHEFLVVPKRGDISPKELGEMVRDVNQHSGAMAKEDVLSDRVYEYDKDAGRILQVPESVEKERSVER